jgi:hypothetical protein
MPEDVLALWRGSETKAGERAVPNAAPAVGSPASQGTATGANAPAIPRTLWWYAMLCVLAAALAESVIGGRYLATLRDEP